MRFIDFLRDQHTELLQLTVEHLFLVAIATGIAVFIGVPLGILLTRKPHLSKPILGFANVMQTVPSLALFGFLIPLNLYLFHVRILGGIGARTAIVALVLYALLPIIRNTFTGINGVDPAIREAGKGMGMSDGQLLFKVELPLSLGVIIAGVRVATVICVGTATIAAAIDAGGLGRFIFRGLRMNDNVLILAGAAPAAVIALAADLLLGFLERALRTGELMRRRGKRIVAFAAGSLLLIGGIAIVAGTQTSMDRIAIGSKDFTEQLILGELLAQTLEGNTTLAVERRFDLGGTLAHDALVAGEIDMYVEYSGTALLAILQQPPSNDPEEVLRRVRAAYARRYDIVWTEPLGFDNTFAILIRADDAKRLNLKTVSDAAKVSGLWRAGFGQDFMSRADGYAGFAATYGFHFQETREMDLALTYRALAEKQIDLIAGNSTDGLIDRYGLVQLRDDKRYFPPYDAVPVVRQATLDKHPQIRGLLARLGGILTVEEMRKLNYAVDGEKRRPREVAHDFLVRKGIVKKISPVS